MQAHSKQDSVTSAILLAAGRGSRLSPHTDNIPKPLLPYRGRPTLEWVFDSLIASGVTKLVVVTHYLENQIEQFIQQYLATHAEPGNLQISTAHQAQLCGTADAVSVAVQSRQDWFADSFIVTATDYLTEFEFYSELVKFHYSHDSEISISLKRLAVESQTMRSSVRIAEDMTISEVVEKPAPGSEPSPFTANLVYILPASVIDYINKIQPTVRGELELQSAINLWLDERGTARGLLQTTPAEWQADMASG